MRFHFIFFQRQVDDLVVDHLRVVGSETQYTFTFKCQTNKARMRKRSAGAATAAAGSSSSGGGDGSVGGGGSADDGSGECPVLWIKVGLRTYYVAFVVVVYTYRRPNDSNTINQKRL